MPCRAMGSPPPKRSASSFPSSRERCLLGMQPRTVQLATSEIDATVAQAQMASLDGKARIDVATGAITVIVPLDKNETEKLTSCLKTPEAKARVEEAVELVRETEMAFGGSGQTRQPSPYERQLNFIVPILCVLESGRLFEFESTYLIERPWQLSAKDASLSAGYNPLVRPAGYTGIVDVGAKGEVQTSVLRETPEADFVGKLHQQVLELGAANDCTVESLIAWLDQNIPHQDIPGENRRSSCGWSFRGLMAKFDIADVSVLGWTASACGTKSRRAFSNIGTASGKKRFKLSCSPTPH